MDWERLQDVLPAVLAERRAEYIRRPSGVNRRIIGFIAHVGFRAIFDPNAA
jgi:hypothetical protein